MREMNLSSADESTPLNDMALGSAHGGSQRELVLLFSALPFTA